MDAPAEKPVAARSLPASAGFRSKAGFPRSAITVSLRCSDVNADAR
jgi:hypothetical protein